MGGTFAAKVDLTRLMCVAQMFRVPPRHTAYGPAYVDHKLAPIEGEIVPLINLPSASSRDRWEACMACVVEAPIS